MIYMCDGFSVVNLWMMEEIGIGLNVMLSSRVLVVFLFEVK